MNVQKLVDIRQKLDVWQETGFYETLQFIKELQTMEITISEIKDSKILKTISAMNKNMSKDDENQKEIGQQCKSIMEKWKLLYNEFKQEKSQKQQQTQETEQSKPRKQIKIENQASSQNSDEKVQNSQYNIKAGLIKAPSTGNPVRDGAMQVMLTSLQVDFDKNNEITIEMKDHLLQIVQNIEKCLFQKNKFETDMNYKSSCRILGSNLKDIKNVQLRQKILNEQVDIEKLVNLDQTVLMSQEDKLQRELIIEQQTGARSLDWYKEFLKKNSTKSNTSCIACKSQQVTTFTLQTRGADEPMTEFHECISCGKKWKH